MNKTVTRYCDNVKDFVKSIPNLSPEDKEALFKGVSAMELAHKRLTKDMVTGLTVIKDNFPNEVIYDQCGEDAEKVLKAIKIATE